MKNRVLWITRTALFIALLIVAQAVTAPLGNKIITGSLVNLILVISVMTCGLSSGLIVAVVSPVFAKLFGIGPFWELIPFIALGNAVLVVIWHFIGNMKSEKRLVPYIIAVSTASVAKFITLYLGIVVIAVPLILNLPEKQAGIISAAFSLPQLLTAVIGGSVAILVLPTLKKAISQRS